MKAKGDTRWLSEQHDRETGRLPEVGHVGGQHRVPERECYSALDQPFEGCSAPFRIDDHAGIENQPHAGRMQQFAVALDGGLDILSSS